jgi:hypothetical protein
MTEQVFEPRNELEQRLLAAQEGRITGEQFIDELMGSQIFMPVRDSVGIQGFIGSSTARPLTVQSADGTEVLILFTSPERAKAFVRDFAGYEGGLLTEFKWVLEKMGVGNYGIALNPGWDVGIDMEPAMVKALIDERTTGNA